MRNIFITGYSGYIGTELMTRDFWPLECDVTNKNSVETAINRKKPSLLIHLAGKSNIEWCEKNYKDGFVVNVLGTRNVFEVTDKLRIPTVLLSSDHIWKGAFWEWHSENSKFTPAANLYGMMKQAAEAVVGYGKIIRTSYIFDSKRLKPHISDMEFGIKKEYPIFIRRSFLHLEDFCDLLDMYCDKYHKMPRILHLAGSETVSWYTLMKELEKALGFKGTVKPRFFPNKDLPPRPYFGGLDTRKAIEFGFPERDFWHGIKRIKNES